MSIRSTKDIADAYANGRHHTQRVIKTSASGTTDSVWYDWSYTGGQPGYDARVGATNAFNPFVATKNDAVWFPAIDASHDRHLVGLRTYNTASGASQNTVEFILYDLLGVYPLIDGDSTDLQEMDNSLTLPRYTTGEGVVACIVNHVAPTVQVGTITLTYQSCNDTSKVVTGAISTSGLTTACWDLAPTGTATPPSPWIPRGAGCSGIKSITSVQFGTAPSGLYSIYLYKPLAHTSNRPFVSSAYVMTEKCFCVEDSFRLPQIYDGAWLGYLYMHNGGARAVSTVYGTFSFIWG